jgi:hypothetical protein
MDLGEIELGYLDCIDLAEYIDQWGSLVNTCLFQDPSSSRKQHILPRLPHVLTIPRGVTASDSKMEIFACLKLLAVKWLKGKKAYPTDMKRHVSAESRLCDLRTA